MAANIIDQLLGATGFSTKIADENVREARKHTIGEAYPGGPSTPALGGLKPAMEAEIGYRDDYLDRFGVEHTRILDQFDENREARTGINEVALAQLPAIGAATTPEGYADRIDQLAGDPRMQRILERQNEFRRREAKNMLASSGLRRSGAAGEAAAQATMTPDEFAFQTEQRLFDRAMQTAGMYQDLPIANQMVADTLQRDLSIADNLVQQGLSRGQADLLMGQISKEATEQMLENLLKVYGEAVGGGGPPVTIVNDVTTQIVNSIKDLIDKGGDWIGGVIEEVLDPVIGDDEDFDSGVPGYAGPIGDDVSSPDVGAPDMDVPGVDFPEVPEAEEPEVPTVPEESTEPLPSGFDQARWEALKARAPEGVADPDQWAREMVAVMRQQAADRREGGDAPPEGDLPPDVGVADPENPVYGDLPGLPEVIVPGAPGGIDNPGLDTGDLLEDIAGDIPLPGFGGSGGGGGLGSNLAPVPGSGQPPPPVAWPSFGVQVLGNIAGFGGREIGETLFDRKATTSWGSTAGAHLGFQFGGPMGAAVGAVLGGLVDSAFGTSDQKNVTVGVATTQPGDDVSGERTLPSGLKLWGINRRGGEGEITEQYMDTIESIDNFLTESAKAAGYDVNLRNFGEDIPTFGGEVKGKGKQLKANPTFFGSATEGSEESDRNHITKNLTQGYDNFVDAWLRAAVDQGQITGDVAEAIGNIQGNTTEKLVGFQQALGFDVEMPTVETPGTGINTPNIPFGDIASLPGIGM